MSDSSLRTLLRQSSHYMVGRGLAIAIGFITFPVWARLFSVADYGVLNLAQRFALVAVAVAKLGMQNAVLRFHEESSGSEDSMRRLYSTALFGTTAGALVCTVACFLFFLLAPAGWIPANITRALLMASGLVFLRATMSPIYGFLRVEGKTFGYNALDVITRLLSLLIGVALVLVMGSTPENLLLGLLVAEALTIVIALVHYVPRARLALAAVDPKLFRTLVFFAAPLAASELAQTMLASADRAFVQHYLGSEPLGYYAAACAIAMILQEALQLPLNLALVPIYIKIWHQEGAEATGRFVGLTFELFLLAATAITAAVYASSAELIVFVSSSKYAPAAPMLGPLVGGYMFMAASIFFSAGFWVQKKTLQMAYLVAAAFAIKSLLNYLLLPWMGLAGAVIPNVAGYVLLAAFYGWFSHRLLPLRISIRRCLLYVAAAVAASLAAQMVPAVHLPASAGLLATLVVRSTVVAAVYGVLVYLFDARIRGWTRQGWHSLLTRLGR